MDTSFKQNYYKIDIITTFPYLKVEVLEWNVKTFDIQNCKIRITITFRALIHCQVGTGLYYAISQAFGV